MDCSGSSRGDDAFPAIQLRVFRVSPATTWYVRTLATNYKGLFTHWVRGQSEYCKDDACRPDWHKLDKLWKGYTPVEIWDRKRKLWWATILEITEGMELDFRDKFDRAQVWELSRSMVTDKHAAPVRARFQEQYAANTVPEPFDMKPVLRSMFHVDQVFLIHDNPMPARIFVPPSQGPSPVPSEKELSPTEAEANRKRLREALMGKRNARNGDGKD